MRTRLLSSVIIVCLPLTAFTLTAAMEREKDFHRLVNSHFNEGVKSRPQRSRRSKKRGTTASPKNNNSSTAQPAPTPSTTAQPNASQSPLSQVSYELPIRRPGAGERQVQGLLTRVDCEAKGVTFIVSVDDSQLRLRTPDLNLVKFTTYTPEVSGEVTCGVRNPANNTVIIYRPPKDARSKFNGLLVSIEFVPKDFKLKQ